MLYSTIYTNHSSSFSTANIIWRNRICIGCSFHGWLFKDWPFDYHDSGAFRTGLGKALHQLELKQWLIQIGSHPDVDALDAPHLEKQDGYDWYLDNKSPLSINTFFAICIKWTIGEHVWSLSSFFCHWMFLNFSVLSPKITFDCDIFLSFRIFGCHCIAIVSFAWLLQYWSISCAVSNSAEGCDVKSKSCLLFMINDQDFLIIDSL